MGFHLHLLRSYGWKEKREKKETHVVYLLEEIAAGKGGGSGPAIGAQRALPQLLGLLFWELRADSVKGTGGQPFLAVCVLRSSCPGGWGAAWGCRGHLGWTHCTLASRPPAVQLCPALPGSQLTELSNQ